MHKSTISSANRKSICFCQVYKAGYLLVIWTIKFHLCGDLPLVYQLQVPGCEPRDTVLTLIKGISISSFEHCVKILPFSVAFWIMCLTGKACNFLCCSRVQGYCPLWWVQDQFDSSVLLFQIGSILQILLVPAWSQRLSYVSIFSLYMKSYMFHLDDITEMEILVSFLYWKLFWLLGCGGGDLGDRVFFSLRF